MGIVAFWQCAPKTGHKGRFRRLSDPAGRNVSEAWAGRESDNADDDPPAIWGRLYERGSNRHAHPRDPPAYWARHVGKGGSGN
jgi:hypothetical protein